MLIYDSFLHAENSYNSLGIPVLLKVRRQPSEHQPQSGQLQLLQQPPRQQLRRQQLRRRQPRENCAGERGGRRAGGKRGGRGALEEGNRLEVEEKWDRINVHLNSNSILLKYFRNKMVYYFETHRYGPMKKSRKL